MCFCYFILVVLSKYLILFHILMDNVIFLLNFYRKNYFLTGWRSMKNWCFSWSGSNPSTASKSFGSACKKKWINILSSNQCNVQSHLKKYRYIQYTLDILFWHIFTFLEDFMNVFWSTEGLVFTIGNQLIIGP